MIFVVTGVFSQEQPAKQQKMLLLQGQKKVSTGLLNPPGTNISITAAKPVISPDFYVTQLGFFCKQEIKFEKVTRVPFRFRLGNVEDCDRMEGKHKRN